MYRSELGAANPSAVFMPILFATSLSTLAGFLAVAVVQRLNVFNRVVMAYLGGFILFIGVVAFYFCSLPETERLSVSANCGNFCFCGDCRFYWSRSGKKLNVYETFVVGAKEGFEIAVRIIPYLVAMLVAIAVSELPEH